MGDLINKNELFPRNKQKPPGNTPKPKLSRKIEFMGFSEEITKSEKEIEGKKSHQRAAADGRSERETLPRVLEVLLP